MKGRLGIVLSLLVATAIVLSACGAATPAPTTAPAPTSVPATAAPAQTAAPTAASTSTVKRGGILKVAVEEDVQDLDPMTSPAMLDWRVMSLVYDFLLVADAKTMAPKPMLATSWEVSADGLTYTFHLKSGVKWHSGDPFTAADVKFTYDRHLNSDNGSVWAAYYDSIKSVDVKDDMTVVFTLKQPYSALLAMIAILPIQNQKFVDANDGKTSRTAMGTGPYMFKEWVPGQVIHFVKNPNYWQMGTDGKALPYLDGIDIIPVVDGTARATNLQAGQVDMVATVPAGEVKKLQGTSGIQMFGPDSVNWSGLWFNCTAKPFDDKRVRQAFAYAIDRTQINAVGLFGLTQPAYGGIVPSWSWAFNDLRTYEKRDVAKAKALLADAGYPDGKGFPAITLPALSSAPEHLAASEMVVTYLKDLGINAKAESMEAGSMFDAIIAGTLPIYYMGFGVPTGDPDEYYVQPFYTNAAWNWPKYSNPAVDKLLDQGRLETDPAKRKDIYRQVETILLDDSPVAFITLESAREAAVAAVKGYVHSSSSTLVTLASVWLDR